MYYVPVPTRMKDESESKCSYVCLGIFLSLVIISVGLFCVENLEIETLTGFFQEQTKTTQEKGEIQEAFENYVQKFGKEYSSDKELKRKFEIFSKNYRKIMKHNEEENSYTMGINQFSDMSEEEFSEYLGTFIPDKQENVTYFDQTNPITDDIDWVAKGKVSAVKNQGQCGSCWAFASIGTVESFHAIKFNQDASNMDLYSEQELVDCSSSFGNQGCNGGWMTKAYKYIIQNGISTSAHYKYVGVVQKCQKTYKDYIIAGYISVPQQNSLQLLQALNTQPLSIAVAAEAWQFYVKGVMTDTDCTGGINH